MSPVSGATGPGVQFTTGLVTSSNIISYKTVKHDKKSSKLDCVLDDLNYSSVKTITGYQSEEMEYVIPEKPVGDDGETQDEAMYENVPRLQ